MRRRVAEAGGLARALRGAEADGLARALRGAVAGVWSGLVMLAASAGGGAAAAPFAYITNQGSHDVSVIDLQPSPRVVATIAVGRSPAGVVASSRAGRAFVANPDSGDISVIDIATQRLIATWPSAAGAVGIDASADGQRLYVADWYGQRLQAFDAASGQPLVQAAVGRAPAGIAAAGEVVFVAERDDDSVAVLDARTLALRGRVQVGAHPFALLFDGARQRLYALNVQSNDVSVLDVAEPAAPKLLATVAVGKAPYGAALAHGGRLLYVTNQHDDSVSVIDADSLQPLRLLRGFAYPEGIAAHGDRVYVVTWMDDNVAVLDAASGAQLTSVATGRNSRGFGAFIAAPSTP